MVPTKLPLRHAELALRAPLTVVGRDAEIPGRLSGSQPYYRVKGRVGELYVREFLYLRPAAHRGRHELDYLYGLFPGYVGAEDAARVAVHYELAETFLVAIDHAAVEVRKRYRRHHAAMPGARLLFRQTYAGVLRVGKAAVGGDLVALRVLDSEHGLFGGEASLVGRALD